MPSPLQFMSHRLWTLCTLLMHQNLIQGGAETSNLMDAEDRSMIAAEVEKYPHPLEDTKIHLYNPVTDQVAPTDVNVMVVDSFFHWREDGTCMHCHSPRRLPQSYFLSIIKKQAKGSKVRPVIDLENMFLWLLMIG